MILYIFIAMVDAALPREVLPVVSVNIIIYRWSLSCGHGLDYAS